jgi:hypothetical protein
VFTPPIKYFCETFTETLKKREVDKHKKVIVVAGAIAKMAIH